MKYLKRYKNQKFSAWNFFFWFSVFNRKSFPRRSSWYLTTKTDLKPWKCPYTIGSLLLLFNHIKLRSFAYYFWPILNTNSQREPNFTYLFWDSGFNSKVICSATINLKMITSRTRRKIFYTVWKQCSFLKIVI